LVSKATNERTKDVQPPTSPGKIHSHSLGSPLKEKRTPNGRGRIFAFKGGSEKGEERTPGHGRVFSRIEKGEVHQLLMDWPGPSKRLAERRGKGELFASKREGHTRDIAGEESDIGGRRKEMVAKSKR